MSFSDATLERFAFETGRPLVLRYPLKASPEDLEAYYECWCGKRKAFLIVVQQHMQASGVGQSGDPVVMFQTVHSEPVPPFRVGHDQNYIVTNRPQFWRNLLGRSEDYTGLRVFDESLVVAERMYYDAITSLMENWG